MKVDISTLGNFFNGVAPHLLKVTLPSTKEEYWTETLTTNARTDCRKARKLGYQFFQLGEIPHSDFVDIYESYGDDLKQGRPVNKRYNAIDFDWYDIGPNWPIDDYTPYTQLCDDKYCGGLHMFGVVNKAGKFVALGEMVVYAHAAVVHAIMGHKDYMKDGVVKLLLVEIASLYLQKNIKKIFYGELEFLEDNRKYFMRDFGFSKDG